jgi:hypothetical protein
MGEAKRLLIHPHFPFCHLKTRSNLTIAAHFQPTTYVGRSVELGGQSWNLVVQPT